MRHAGISIGKIGGAALALLSLAACAPPVGPDAKGPAPVEKGLAGYTALRGAAGEMLVRRVAAPFSYADGAEAKRAANGFCGPDGVASGPADNFREGAWVFPGGCA